MHFGAGLTQWKLRFYRSILEISRVNCLHKNIFLSSCFVRAWLWHFMDLLFHIACLFDKMKRKKHALKYVVHKGIRQLCSKDELVNHSEIVWIFSKYCNKIVDLKLWNRRPHNATDAVLCQREKGKKRRNPWQTHSNSSANKYVIVYFVMAVYSLTTFVKKDMKKWN